MNAHKAVSAICLVVALAGIFNSMPARAQGEMATHTRGKLWETLWNFGFIGDTDIWNYGQVTGVGMYPGFPGWFYPDHEEKANQPDMIVDANFHNFKSGPAIIAKGPMAPVPPDWHFEPTDFLIYHSAMAGGQEGVLNTRVPFQSIRNFNGAPNFNPVLPEEINIHWFHTVTGVTVKQRSYAWSYPGYRDFIIYDFVFTNTGEVAVPSINQIKHFEQTLQEVWIMFQSQLQVSTKGMINFHYDPDFLQSAAPAGGFGWHHDHGWTDRYAVDVQAGDPKGLFYYMRDVNGGREPADTYGRKANWRDLLTNPGATLPELQDPACFGFVFLYCTPPAGGNPLDADPTFFNIYSDEHYKFKGAEIDFEDLGPALYGKKFIYDYATHNFLPPANDNIYAMHTSSFGPYTLAPGDSVRLIVAEVAGVMDLHEVYIGDPEHHFPDSSIAAIERNVEAARRALQWGIGASSIQGIPVVADVPEPPPAPNCFSSSVSAGIDTPQISVRWDKTAEEAKITDASGGVFYDGATDLSGYRIYRSKDKRGIWNLAADIPRSELSRYWRPEENLYEYLDRSLQFGDEFYYYVQTYNSSPKTWTSANGTVVNNLGALVSGDFNRTPLTNARPGPINLVEKGWDVFVAPNPYVESDPQRSFGEPTPRKIEFRNLPERATIKIYSLSGDLVKTLTHGPDEFGNMFGSISWDQYSDSGLLVAPGLYVYVVQANTPDSYQGTKATGKLMIVR